jgi:hypothetical protein
MIADQDMGDCIPSKPSSSPEHVTLKQGIEVGLHLFKRKVESRRFLVIFRQRNSNLGSLSISSIWPTLARLPRWSVRSRQAIIVPMAERKIPARAIVIEETSGTSDKSRP